MSFKRLEPEDFLISTDAIVAPAFSNGSITSTGTAQVNSGVSANYYTAINGSDGRLELAVTYGNKTATGANINQQVVYRQFANVITGDSGGTLPIGDSFVAVTLERSRFKQSIFPASFRIASAIGGSPTGTVQTGSNDVNYGNAGRVYSNAGGTIYLYPDIGAVVMTGSSLATSIGSGAVVAESEEVITSNFVFVRARNAEFNYSQNPTFIDSGSGGVRYTDFITAPQTFITTVGLYNDNGDLLAVAKLSKPLKKDFTKEALIRVKLDF